MCTHTYSYKVATGDWRDWMCGAGAVVGLRFIGTRDLFASRCCERMLFDGAIINTPDIVRVCSLGTPPTRPHPHPPSPPPPTFGRPALARQIHSLR